MKQYKPMLAEIGTENILTRENYVFEPKMDGVRAICYKKDDTLEFRSRNGLNITLKYPEFDFVKNIKPKSCVLDGEIVIYDEEGNPSFYLWQERNSGVDLIANYVVFDILEMDGNDLTDIPFSDRKELLDKAIIENERLQKSIVTKDGKKLWDIVKKRKLEGVIAKKVDSVYHEGRSDLWQKVKINKTADCFVLGYTIEKRALTSLALGVKENNELVFAGKVGTGFDSKMIGSLREQLDELKIEKPEMELPDEIIPVAPEIIVEIKYQNITADKKFRAPVFLKVKE